MTLLTKANVHTAMIGAEIERERRRQRSKEGWTLDHDDAHTDGELAQAAACYALPSQHRPRYLDPRIAGIPGWPKSWHPSWWKPKDRRRDLIRAAALIVAEIERLDRAKAKGA
jgi:hypothetical protein